MYRSLDPIHAYDAYSADVYREETKLQLIADEMYNMKHDAMERIDAIIHPEYAAEFIKILCLNFNEGEHNAESLAYRLGLTQQHIYALMNDEKNFRINITRNVFTRDECYEDRFVDYI